MFVQFCGLESLFILLILKGTLISFNSFWDANIKSILLTDTCYQRNPLFSCQSSSNCDNYLTASRDDNLGFMYNTVTAAKNLTKFLVCSDSGNELCVIIV